MSTYRIGFLVFSIFALVLRLPASAGPTAIARSQARDLVLRALQERGYPTTAKNFELDDGNDKYFPNFYWFQSYSNSEVRLVSTGIFAVNKKTADIWDTLLCKRIDLAALRPLQEKLRKQAEVTAQEYAELTKEAPCHTD
jgi:hypothetical protein